MLKEGMDVYLPLVDDHAVDAIVRRDDGTIALVQIKARSRDVLDGNAARFAAIEHDQRDEYWFVFYSERLDLIWIMRSKEFIQHAARNKSGKNAGKRSILFSGKRRNKTTGMREEYCKPQWEKYLASDFSRIRGGV